jgi:hypothetical protein
MMLGYDNTLDVGLIAAAHTGTAWKNISIPYGNVGIGTTSPSFLLDVNGTGRFSGNLRVQNASSGRYFDFVTDSSASYLDVSHSLNVRVNGASSLTTALTIASTGAAEFSSTIKTAAPTGYTAKPWKLGDATSGTITPNYYIKVEIDGQIYAIPALQGLP